MEIRVPQTLNDCDLHRLAKWVKYRSEIGNIETLGEEIEFRVEVVSIFSGLTKKEVIDKPIKLLNKAYVHCIVMLAEYEEQEPKGVIEHEGKRYTFEKEIHNISTAQVIDLKVIEDIYKQPYELMATLYVEEGMKYNQEEDKKVLNPRVKREEEFKKMPIGEEFMNLIGFFLSDYILLNLATRGIQMKEEMKNMSRWKRFQIRMMSGTSGLRTLSRSLRK